VYAESSSDITLNGCLFEGNTVAMGGGGAQFVTDTLVTATACTFIGNGANVRGGGVVVGAGGQASFTNTLFVENDGGGLGGGLSVASFGGLDTLVTIVNSTFSQNQAMTGGAIAAEAGSLATVTNSILWGDGAPEEIAIVDDGMALVSYSDVQGGWAGMGNHDVDPMFADPSASDYRIREPEITDGGDNCAVPDGVDTDLDRNPRFVDYPGALNVGVPGCEGGDGIVDMGAYERQCPADCNADGQLNILDFVCFQGQWQAQAFAADCDANGQFDILDFVCFQGAFQLGCP